MPVLPNPCSFCGQDQKQVKTLIAGPGVFICDVCIDRVHTVLAVTGRTASTPIALIQQVNNEARTERCSFCGKPRHQVSVMASAGDTRICDECLRQCREIRRERLN
jgi:ATP-dependent protease Clp ATPase subunit